MKKTVIGIAVLLLVAFAAPVFAQSPFADVPTDHWAYDAVEQLQQAGLMIGYPDGTFRGKTALTRYEFAVAIARMIPVLEERIAERIGTPGAPAGGVSQDQFNQLQQRVSALEAAKGGVSAEQFRALQNLVNEFRDELAALGVDVDALKRDVAALAARVDALEKEVRRVKFNGELNVFGTATAVNDGAPIDIDGRPFQPEGAASGEIINSISFVRDMDLKVTGNVSPGLTAYADINFGNYLPSYLGGVVTDYPNFVRPSTGTVDEFIPYYMYAEAGLGKGSFTIGRIPVQYTPYTMKMIDVDSYTFNSKTDTGDYPLDGAKANYKFGNINLMGFAAKTNQNSLLGAGLISQPTIALYDPADSPASVGSFNVLGGHAAGGLDTIDQVAGARAVIGTPFNGNLGLTFIEAAGPVAGYDTVDIFGVDGKIQLGAFGIAAEYAQTKTTDGDDVLADIDDNNTAIDGAIQWGAGKLGIDLGYRMVERNFAGPGYWTKIGMWTNPTNIQGPYLDLNYGLTPAVSLVVDGAWYEGADDFAALPAVGGLPAAINTGDDNLWNAKAGLKWGFGKTNTVNLGAEFVSWNPDAAPNSDETYWSLGWAHQFSNGAGLNLSYQIVDYNTDGGAATPYGATDYKGGVAVAQFDARF